MPEFLGFEAGNTLVTHAMSSAVAVTAITPSSTESITITPNEAYRLASIIEWITGGDNDPRSAPSLSAPRGIDAFCDTIEVEGATVYVVRVGVASDGATEPVVIDLPSDFEATSDPARAFAASLFSLAVAATDARKADER